VRFPIQLFPLSLSLPNCLSWEFFIFNFTSNIIDLIVSPNPFIYPQSSIPPMHVIISAWSRIPHMQWMISVYFWLLSLPVAPGMGPWVLSPSPSPRHQYKASLLALLSALVYKVLTSFGSVIAECLGFSACWNCWMSWLHSMSLDSSQVASALNGYLRNPWSWFADLRFVFINQVRLNLCVWLHAWSARVYVRDLFQDLASPESATTWRSDLECSC
jgi:hypothetical protein